MSRRRSASWRRKIEREMEHCLCYGREREASSEFGECAPRAHDLTQVFLSRLPEIRALLVRDVQAAFDGDPAATNLDEVILAYPGVLAVSVYRIAHALYDLGVPMMARIMTEWAHSKTGCDIHPGAKIGGGFFIDHATGVVIGETTEIGEGREALPGRHLGRPVAAQGSTRDTSSAGASAIRPSRTARLYMRTQPCSAARPWSARRA